MYPSLFLKTRDGDYTIVYDTTANIEPRMVLPSTAFSGGINLSIKRLNIAYTVGYQWENIKIYDIVKKEDYDQYLSSGIQVGPYWGERTTIVFNNNFWFNKLFITFDLRSLKRVVPALYTSATLSLGKKSKTGWHTIQAGIAYKINASPNQKNKKTYKKTQK